MCWRLSRGSPATLPVRAKAGQLCGLDLLLICGQTSLACLGISHSPCRPVGGACGQRIGSADGHPGFGSFPTHLVAKGGGGGSAVKGCLSVTLHLWYPLQNADHHEEEMAQVHFLVLDMPPARLAAPPPLPAPVVLAAALLFRVFLTAGGCRLSVQAWRANGSMLFDGLATMLVRVVACVAAGETVGSDGRLLMARVSVWLFW